MATILITGAFGFVGTNLSAFLAQQGHRLLALDVAVQSPSAYAAFSTWNDLDSLDWNSLDAIIHLAGKAHDTSETADSKSYFDINVGLTQRVFDRFVASSARTFIFFSSVKAAADAVPGQVLTEDLPANPKTAYGRSKLEAEKLILGQTLGHDRRALVLRPCMIHGPGNKGNLNLLHKFVARGVPYPLGAYDNHRSLVSIGNLCFLIDRMLRTPPLSGIYQIADDEPLSTGEIVRLMAEARGRKPRIWSPPRFLVQSAARVGDFLRLPLNSERLRKLTESYVVSNAKIKAALNIDRMPIRARDGLKATLASL